ncbi:helix-turn-helix domain-containing protein [Kitasatospora sp. NBC_00458]|uniref:helix-turn-helix domain-containing protein n=1 Tax=Kitasatospora sp. NBC_00458 TaxID=2903568 RepID=UPI002E17DFE2
MVENADEPVDAAAPAPAAAVAVAGTPGAAGPAGGPGGLPRERLVKEAATLKALADPLRLGILGALNSVGAGPLTAKEIAAALGEPQTKLYRHIKQLEKAGLIRVAGTRLVSGIVESRYAPGQESVRLAPEIFSADSPTRGEAFDAMLASIDRVRDDFRDHALSGRVDFSTPEDGSVGLPGLFSHFTLRLSPEQLVRLRAQFKAVFDELRAAGQSTAEDAVEVAAFTLLYGVQPDAAAPAPPGSRSGTRPGTDS